MLQGVPEAFRVREAQGLARATERP